MMELLENNIRREAGDIASPRPELAQEIQSILARLDETGIDFSEALHGAGLAETKRYTRSRSSLFLTLWKKRAGRPLSERLEKEAWRLKRTFLTLRDDREQGALELGMYMGFIRAMLSLMETESEGAAASTMVKSPVHEKLPEIVRYLAQNHSATHETLAAAVHLKPSTLTEAMKKMERTGLLQTARSGKFKLYSLTPDGVEYDHERERLERQAAVAQPWADLTELTQLVQDSREVLRQLQAEVRALGRLRTGALQGEEQNNPRPEAREAGDLTKERKKCLALDIDKEYLVSIDEASFKSVKLTKYGAICEKHFMMFEDTATDTLAEYAACAQEVVSV